MNTHWKKLGETLLQKTRIFDLYSQRMLFPDGKSEDDFFYLKTADWVNVLPITREGEVVLVKQFRMGVQELCLETPGGIVDPGETDVAAAGMRELAEETGYVPGRLLPLGSLFPNPALLNNRCSFFLALDCEKKHELHLDPSEDITVHLIPLREIRQRIRDGELQHSIFYAVCMLALVHYPEELRTFWDGTA